MKQVTKWLLLILAIAFCFGCASLKAYKQADQYKDQVRSLALLPLIIGDESGKVEKIGGSELMEFITYFDSRFYKDFEQNIQLINDIELKVSGRDFEVDRFGFIDYFSIARELDVDAVLGINITLYNEVKPGAKGAEIAAAVVTTVLLGGYVTENQIVGYDTHYAYLGIEKVDQALRFEYKGRAFPTIDEQRAFFVDSLISYLDTHFPLSTDYVQAYKD